MKRILVIQTAFLGDCVLSLPFFKRLRDLEPEAEIHVVCTAVGAELFEVANQESKLGLKINILDKRGAHRSFLKMRSFIKKLKGDGVIDVAFCLQRSFRSALLAYLSGAPKRVGFSSGAASYFYTLAVPRDWDTGKHEIEKNLDLLRYLAYPVEAWVGTESGSILRPGFKIRGESADPIAFSLSSPWPTKQWQGDGASNLIAQLTQLGEKILLLGDQKAIPIHQEILKKVPSLLIQDMAGKTSVSEWISQIASSKLLVSGDSAAVHVASDLGIPVVAIFGPTVPDFGFAPWRRNAYAVGLSQLPCRPCHIHGPKTTPYSPRLYEKFKSR